MKKGTSISLALLMLVAMLHLSVAVHYCGGEVAASRISISGKLASCGMEGSENSCPIPGDHLKSACCNDVVTVYKIDGNYTPSFTFLPESYKANLQVFELQGDSPLRSNPVLTYLFSGTSPPDDCMSTSVDLADICVLRI